MFDDVWKNIAPGEERTFSDESVMVTGSEKKEKAIGLD